METRIKVKRAVIDKLLMLMWKAHRILTENNIDVRVLTKIPDCELCRDSGIIDGKICKCAIEKTEQIKVYNAEIRKQTRVTPK